jgi:hypothetical protein
VPGAYCKERFDPATWLTEKTCAERAAVGTACPLAGSCVSGSECEGTSGSTTCVALPKDGDPCSPGGAPCEDAAAYCDPVTSTCQPLLKENAPCVLASAHPTAPYTAGCYAYNECKGGVCTRLPIAGQPCNPDPTAIDECFLVGKCVDGFCKADPPRPLCTVAAAQAAAGSAHD